MNKVFENVFVKVLCAGNKVREKGRGKDSGTEGGREGERMLVGCGPQQRAEGHGTSSLC